MSRPRKLSSFRLKVTQRFRRSWTHWRLQRTGKQLLKAEARLLLLQLEVDSQHLRVKELVQQRASLQHRLKEELESQEWHLAQPLLSQEPEPELPPEPPVDPLREKLDQVLGMSTLPH